ncbi:MAG: potassium transporter, partial [Gammaproteobacteria bacterium]
MPLAVLFALGGIWMLRIDLGETWRAYADALLSGTAHLQPRLLPSLLIGGGMMTMALGLLLRSRLAWTMALLLVTTAGISLLFTGRPDNRILLGYFVVMLMALLAAWRQFDRSSVAASTLFALTSVGMLLMYATFGSYYLGADFKPHITDLVTALYYA